MTTRGSDTARQDAIRVIDDHLHQVEQALNVAMPDQAHPFGMLDGFQKLKRQAAESTRLNDIKALQVTSSEMLQSAYLKIEAMTKAPKPDPDGEDTPRPTPPIRKLVKLSDMMEQVSTNDTLESVVQVDAFVKSLSSELRVQVMRGNIVTLK